MPKIGFSITPLVANAETPLFGSRRTIPLYLNALRFALFVFKVQMKADRAAIVVAEAGVQRAGGIRLRPGGCNCTVALGKTGNLSLDEIQRGQSGFLVHQVVFLTIANEKRNL